MSMDYNYYPVSSQYSPQTVCPMWNYTNEYNTATVGTNSLPVQANQFWGFGPAFGFGFGGPFLGPFGFGRFHRPFFGRPFFHPFWGWGGWW